MFKRVQKRQRKQEIEEELGLDSEMKEVLGLHDTDSEESESSSDEDELGSRSGEEGGSGDVSVDDIHDEISNADSSEEVNEETDEEDDLPPMSVTDAVSDPLYSVSMDSGVRACILCPGKLLKNLRMADVHKSSKVSRSL